MRRNLFATILLVLSALLLSSCGKDNKPTHSEASQKSIQALEALYPSATGVSWRVKGIYDIATFKLPASAARTVTVLRSGDDLDMEAWFVSQDGSWRMSKETEIAFTQLPVAVQTAFKQGEYADWKIDEVLRIEREGAETLYVIEVEQRDKEAHLFYTPDGVLIRVAADLDDDYDYEDEILDDNPDFIHKFLKEHYPNARILDIDEEDGMIEVEILDGKIQREILFKKDGSWIVTRTDDLLLSEVPETVRQALKGSKYSSYEIDDIEHFITPDREFYRFELEGDEDVTIDITLAGEISLAKSDDNDDDNDDMHRGLADEILQIINTKYPGAKVLDVDDEDGLLEIEISHEGKTKKVYFTRSNAWVRSYWKLSESEVPAKVREALSKAHPTAEIDDVYFLDTPKGQYYAFELEDRDDDQLVFITPEGTIADVKA